MIGWTVEAFDGIACELMYKAHGGSGMNLSARDIDETELRHLIRWREWLEKRREAEADAMKKAYGKR